jgi:hypothetical protein
MIGEPIHEQVVNDRAVAAQQRRVLDLSDGERFDVVTGDRRHEAHGVGPAHDHFTHVRHIEHATRRTDGRVLGGDAGGILHRHFITGEGDDLRAERDMNVMERRTLEHAGSDGCHI